MMKNIQLIKRIFLRGSLILSPIVLGSASACQDQRYLDLKKVIRQIDNQEENNLAQKIIQFEIKTDEKNILSKEIRLIKNEWTTLKEKFKLKDIVLAEIENNPKLNSFTCEYLFARGLLKAKFLEQNLNDKYGIELKSFDEIDISSGKPDTKIGFILKLKTESRIYDSFNLTLHGTKAYGANHKHLILEANRDYVKNPLSVSEAFIFLLNKDGKYTKGL